MVTILATANPGAQSTAPSITLPANIPDNTPGLVVVHSTSANSPVDLPGWTIKDGPRQAGNAVTQSYLFQRLCSSADSGATFTGTIDTTGSPRWATMAILAVDGAEDSITYLADSSPDVTMDVPAFSPNSENVLAVTIGAATVVSGLGHATVTPQAGYVEVIDTGSSFGTLNEVNVFASRRQLANTAGATMGAASMDISQAARANIWVVTYKPSVSAPQALHVGGAVSSNATTTTGANPALLYPAEKQGGDLAIMGACWNPATNAEPTVPGYTRFGAIRAHSASMATACYTKTLTTAENSVIPTYGVAARMGFTLDIWRNVSVAGVAWADAASDTAQTITVPAVSGLSGNVVWSTSWFERSGVDTAVTVPAGTILVGATYPTGSGAIPVAVAYRNINETDGSVGAGVWARGNISPAAAAGVVAMTVALQVGSGVVVTGTGRFRFDGTTWVPQNTNRL